MKSDLTVRDREEARNYDAALAALPPSSEPTEDDASELVQRIVRAVAIDDEDTILRTAYGVADDAAPPSSEEEEEEEEADE